MEVYERLLSHSVLGWGLVVLGLVLGAFRFKKRRRAAPLAVVALGALVLALPFSSIMANLAGLGVFLTVVVDGLFSDQLKDKPALHRVGVALAFSPLLVLLVVSWKSETTRIGLSSTELAMDCDGGEFDGKRLSRSSLTATRVQVSEGGYVEWRFRAADETEGYIAVLNDNDYVGPDGSRMTGGQLAGRIMEWASVEPERKSVSQL